MFGCGAQYEPVGACRRDLTSHTNSLAVAAPEWLREVADPEWFGRYGSRTENFNLPKTEAARQKLATVIGSDGRKLLQAIHASDVRAQLEKLDAVSLLGRVWTSSSSMTTMDSRDCEPWRRCSLPQLS